MPPGNAFTRIAPVFATADLARALEHYARLGFDTHAYEGGARYGYARRGDVEIHLAEVAGLDPATTTSCAYLWVHDADALFAEWSGAGVPGRVHAPRDTEYGLREGAHVDPDGNLIRFGSPLSSDTA